MIAEAKAAKPDIPLEPAEEFLYTLSSIPELKARLSLLKFNYEFQQVEEVCVCLCGVRRRKEGRRMGGGGEEEGSNEGGEGGRYIGMERMAIT